MRDVAEQPADEATALLHAHRGAQFRYSSNMWKVAKAAGLDPMIAF